MNKSDPFKINVGCMWWWVWCPCPNSWPSGNKQNIHSKWHQSPRTSFLSLFQLMELRGGSGIYFLNWVLCLWSLITDLSLINQGSYRLISTDRAVMWEEFCSWLGFTEGVLSLALKCCRRARRSPSLPSSFLSAPLSCHVVAGFYNRLPAL